MTQAVKAHGVLLQIGDGGGPENFTTIVEVTDVTGPGTNLNLADVTAMDGNGWQEFINTIKNGGQVTFTINYVPTQATHQQLITDLFAATLRNFELQLPGGVTWAFAAFVQTFEPAGVVDAALSGNITLQASNTVTST